MSRKHYSALLASSLVALTATVVINQPVSLTDASVQKATAYGLALDTPIRQAQELPAILSIGQVLEQFDVDHRQVTALDSGFGFLNGVGGPTAFGSIDSDALSKEIEQLNKQINSQQKINASANVVFDESEFDIVTSSTSLKADSIDQVLSERPQEKVDAGRLLAAEPIHGAKLTSPFGYRNLGGHEFHPGVDLAAPTGTAILATGNGTVVFAGWMRGYGRLIEIDHGQGYITRYGHSSAIYVAKGDRVSQGQKIAAVGCSGRCTGPHLHYEVRKNGRLINPAVYLAMAKE